jgi:hypothetical protein
MAHPLAALLGLYMTGCTLIFTVWGFQRLVGKRSPNVQILALEERVEQLEVAVAEARRNLQPVPAYPQDSGHLHNLRTFKTLDGLSVKCVECGYVERLENPWPTS